jgi:hypothetical protein
VGLALATGLLATAPAQSAEPQAGPAAQQRQRTTPEGAVEPKPKDATPPSARVEESAPGKLRLGSFIVYPEVRLTEIYDDNIFATRSGEVGDLVSVLTPSIALKSDWKRHRLNFRAGTELSRYANYHSENTSDYWLDMDGRYDLSGNANVFGGLGYSRNHEDRSSPDDVNGTEPVVYFESSAYAGLFRQFDRFSLRAGGTFERLDFRDVPAIGGSIINNDDRDRDVSTGGARLGYRLDSGAEVFGQASVDTRRYAHTPDDNGTDRNSDGYRLAAGVKRSLGDNASGEFFVGWLKQNYVDPAIPDVSVPDFGARVRWQASPKTSVSTNLSRSLEETTLYDSTLMKAASSYIYTRLRLSAEHQLQPRLSVNGLLLAGHSDYQGLNRTDDLYVAGVGLKYRLTKQVYLEADYRFLNRNSTDAAADYYRNQVFLRLRGLLYPVAAPDTTYAFAEPLFAPVTGGYPGFYVGAQTGWGGLNTDDYGARSGGSGREDAKFGNFGAVNGLFGGFGITHNRWYLGLELEGDRGNMDWRHSKDKPESRTFFVEKGDSYGVSGRLGYLLGNGAMLYGRLGAVRTDFHTYYTENDALANAVDATFKQNGVRYGLGVEMPASKNLFWRFDYSYTDYRAYPLDYATGLDHFNNSEALFRLGLGWRFNAQPLPAQPVHIDYSGFYAGAQINHEELASRAFGEHRDSGAGPFNFNANFANHGAGAGVFAGYNWALNQRWYLGVELSAETSSTAWYHNRDSGGGAGGRDFSVDKKGGYAASARLGYELANGTLIYGRVGAVRTKFNTTWVKGGNASAWVDRDDKLSGTRVGVGMELPVARSTSLRFDYSYTVYDRYGFTTTQANYDVMNFDNRENQFRMGVAVHF